MIIPFLTSRSLPWWIFFWVWFWVLFYLSGIVPKVPSGVNVSDKVIHFLFYGFGGGLLGGALLLGRDRIGGVTAGLVIAIGITLIGIFDEWHQSFTPGRWGNDLGDMTANALGGIVAGLLCPFFFGWLRRRAGQGDDSPT